ncbi:unnamed protein product [Trichobilharzia regenti]|nr:unnamed protein product [Trichobilharzia regenti]
MVWRKRSFEEAIKDCGYYSVEPVEENSIDLLDRLLTFNPTTRISVEEALAHPYFEHYYDPSDEPVAKKPFSFEEELDNLPVRQLKKKIFQEVSQFREPD